MTIKVLSPYHLASHMLLHTSCWSCHFHQSDARPSFFWMYLIDLSRTACHPITLVPRALPSVLRASSASYTQVTQFHPIWPCLIGTLRSILTSRSIFSTFPIIMRTSSMLVARRVTSLSSKKHSDWPAAVIRSFAWNRMPWPFWTSNLGPTSRPQWYLAVTRH